MEKMLLRMRKQRGFVVAFPSWTLHQVTPVTQGNRQSLVAWITGPAPSNENRTQRLYWLLLRPLPSGILSAFN
jgi:predicted 2-oxoglutarate/Fe(II)-dependent dioxygenase YbiX